MKMLAPLMLTQLQVMGEPVASIGRVDGDPLQALTNVMEVHEDGRGNVYVVQQATRHIAVFDSLGDHVATLGREGAGPGEFNNPARVSVVRDTVYISDLGHRKVVVFLSRLRARERCSHRARMAAVGARRSP